METRIQEVWCFSNNFPCEFIGKGIRLNENAQTVKSRPMLNITQFADK